MSTSKNNHFKIHKSALIYFNLPQLINLYLSFIFWTGGSMLATQIPIVQCAARAEGAAINSLQTWQFYSFCWDDKMTRTDAAQSTNILLKSSKIFRFNIHTMLKFKNMVERKSWCGESWQVENNSYNQNQFLMNWNWSSF